MWDPDNQNLRLINILEEGQYAPGLEGSGTTKVVKEPKIQLVGIFANPMGWRLLQEKEEIKE
jgi:hypothetical protein